MSFLFLGWYGNKWPNKRLTSLGIVTNIYTQTIFAARITNTILTMIEIYFLVFLAICISILSVILAVHSSVCCLSRPPIAFKDPHEEKHVIIVTSHPDDECMFFAPTILGLQQLLGCTIHLMCLSNGDFYGQGKIREKELLNSCKVLGIDRENCTIINDECLPDDPNIKWKPEVITRYIKEEISKAKFHMLVTFDSNGVSGHPNHNAIYAAVRNMVNCHQIPQDLQVFSLETTNILRKYVGIFDLPLSMLLSPIYLAVSFSHVMQARQAMVCHKSQYVWFRRLYIFFSRYMIMNTLKPVMP